MSKMVERVAMAIDPLAWVVPDEDYPAERSRRGARQFASMSAAKRAIEALSLPTDNMVEKGGIQQNSDRGGPDSIWRAMIEEALK